MPGTALKYAPTISGASGSAPPLTDNHGREITYLRLGVTDRCNLRCTYCMPEKGIDLLPHDEILTFEELSRLVVIFTSMGVSKVRLTGGEPFAGLDCMSFLEHLDQGVLDLKQMLRSGRDARDIGLAIRQVLQERQIDGRAAGLNSGFKEQQSMASIGG